MGVIVRLHLGVAAHGRSTLRTPSKTTSTAKKEVDQEAGPRPRARGNGGDWWPSSLLASARRKSLTLRWRSALVFVFRFVVFCFVFVILFHFVFCMSCGVSPLCRYWWNGRLDEGLLLLLRMMAVNSGRGLPEQGPDAHWAQHQTRHQDGPRDRESRKPPRVARRNRSFRDSTACPSRRA